MSRLRRIREVGQFRLDNHDLIPELAERASGLRIRGFSRRCNMNLTKTYTEYVRDIHELWGAQSTQRVRTNPIISRRCAVH